MILMDKIHYFDFSLPLIVYQDKLDKYQSEKEYSSSPQNMLNNEV